MISRSDWWRERANERSVAPRKMSYQPPTISAGTCTSARRCATERARQYAPPAGSLSQSRVHGAAAASASTSSNARSGSSSHCDPTGSSDAALHEVRKPCSGTPSYSDQPAPNSSEESVGAIACSAGGAATAASHWVAPT